MTWGGGEGGEKSIHPSVEEEAVVPLLAANGPHLSKPLSPVKRCEGHVQMSGVKGDH